jgi:hypothetical protein
MLTNDSLEPSGEEEPILLTEQEQEDLNDAEKQPPAVIYSGQDFDAEGLVRRLSRDDIMIPTFGHDDNRIVSAGFQRAFVWTRSQMDRFIETLLLGYPIPGIFLVKQRDHRYLVLAIFGRELVDVCVKFHAARGRRARWA